jgi:putative MFS transporter
VGRTAEAERITAALEQAAIAETGRALPPLGPVAADASVRNRFADIWRPPYGGRVVVLSIFNFAQSIGFYGFAAWVPTLLVSKGVTVTTSLLYSFVIAIANPIGPVLGYLVADRFERKHQIVLAAGGAAVFGMIFATQTNALAVVAIGVLLTLCNNWMSVAFHGYQAELFPTRIRGRAVGFVYSWSRVSAAFAGLVIGYLLHARGVVSVFVLIAAAMLVVMAAIGFFGPRTRGLSLEEICPGEPEPPAPAAAARPVPPLSPELP